METKIVNINREQGIERDPNYVYIGRGSIYGNPFSHLPGKTGALVKVENRDESVDSYKKWIDGEIQLSIKPPTKEEINKLKGKVLGCFCMPARCHGQILKEIAEQEELQDQKWPSKEFKVNSSETHIEWQKLYKEDLKNGMPPTVMTTTLYSQPQKWQEEKAVEILIEKSIEYTIDSLRFITMRIPFETKECDDLLEEMKKNGVRIGLVV